MDDENQTEEYGTEQEGQATIDQAQQGESFGENETSKQEESKVSDPNESVEETIKKSIEELKSSSPDEDKESKPQEQNSDSKKRRGRPSKNAQDDGGEIPVPNDWTAEGKEAFKKYDRAAQREFSKLSKEYQAWRQREVNGLIREKQALEQEKGHFKSITDTVSRFLPLWGREGITAEAALSEVCSFYTQYMHDPHNALRDLAQKAGLKDVKISESSKQTVDPHVSSLTERLNSVENMISNSQQQVVQYQTQALGEQIDREYEALRDEEVQPGKYKYPDLHDVHFCKQNIEPLVIGLARANPHGANYTELIKRCYIASGGRVIPGNIPTKLNGTRSVAAQRASASVSGVGGATPTGGELPFIPNESVEDTIRRTKAMLSSR